MFLQCAINIDVAAATIERYVADERIIEFRKREREIERFMLRLYKGRASRSIEGVVNAESFSVPAEDFTLGHLNHGNSINNESFVTANDRTTVNCVQEKY